MTITGIIAEFNPFHNGHKYLLDQAEGLKIVAMSGNFMQRGEPAIVDKWTRAQMALENGADLVVELPFLVSVQAADFFGQGAVDILARLGIDSLVFGTEEVLDYQKIADLYTEQGAEMEQFVENLSDSLSYPQKTRPCGRNLLVLIFQEIPPIMSLLLLMPRQLQDETSGCIRLIGRALVTILWIRMWTLPRRQLSVSTRGTKIS